MSNSWLVCPAQAASSESSKTSDDAHATLRLLPEPRVRRVARAGQGWRISSCLARITGTACTIRESCVSGSRSARQPPTNARPAGRRDIGARCAGQRHFQHECVSRAARAEALQWKPPGSAAAARSSAGPAIWSVERRAPARRGPSAPTPRAPSRRTPAAPPARRRSHDDRILGEGRDVMVICTITEQTSLSCARAAGVHDRRGRPSVAYRTFSQATMLAKKLMAPLTAARLNPNGVASLWPRSAVSTASLPTHTARPTG